MFAHVERHAMKARFGVRRCDDLDIIPDRLPRQELQACRGFAAQSTYQRHEVEYGCVEQMPTAGESQSKRKAQVRAEFVTSGSE